MADAAKLLAGGNLGSRVILTLLNIWRRDVLMSRPIYGASCNPHVQLCFIGGARRRRA